MAKSGSDEQLAQRFDEEIDALHRFAWSLSRDAETAQDLTQETCLRAWRSRATRDQGRDAKPWLYRIMKNLWLDMLRERQRTPELVEFDEATTPTSGAPLTPPLSTVEDRAAFESELDDEVLAAINDLHADEQVVIMMQSMTDLRYGEIAAALECPVGTVMSRLHRSKTKLRQRLTHYARQVGILRSDSPEPTAPTDNQKASS